MFRSDRIRARALGRAFGLLGVALALLLGAASPAQAEDCSAYPGGVLDGFAGTPAPSQLNIDQNCTVRNYPGGMSTNFSFFTQPGQEDQRWLVIFDNVVHTGQMSCNAVHEHKIWFVNGSSSGIHQNCQNLLIPVEKIEKQNPAGQTTAAVGVPFTWRLVIPVLFDPATGTVIDFEGSPNDLHGITVWDDLNATGVDLTYLSHTAYWLDSGTPVPHTFSNAGGSLTFDLFPIVPAGDQFVIELTVVLEDTPTNAPGTQFVNTAKWDFGRLIDGEFFEPLPGEWGISPPLTIAAPQLVVTKTGPATLGRTLNLGEWGQFGVDVHNTGLTDAWDVTLLDRLPDGSTGGMCDLTPELLSVTLAGNPLSEGTHYTLSWAGPSTCELTLTLLDAAGPIGPDQHLVVSYRTKLDADSEHGATLTNVVGATEWFNDDSANPDRIAFVRAISDGTPGVLDHEDAHTVTVALFGYFFEKSVANLTTGANPTATAAPGDTLRYRLRLQSTDIPLDALTFQDDLGVMNAFPAFVPGSLTLVSVPPGADPSNTNPNGGTNGAGLLDVRNLSLPAFGEAQVVFDITLLATVADGSVVLNQADLVNAGLKIADSDDPNVNGQADPSVLGDEDPTQVVIDATPAGPLAKANTQATATIGEEFSYQITVPQAPLPFPMYDVQILDDLTGSAADLRFVSVAKVSGSQPWTPVNTGTDTNLVIEDPALGIDIPAGEQAVVEITVVLEDTPTNVAGLSFTNTASYTYNRIDADDTSELPGEPGTSPPMTIVEPVLTLDKSGPTTMTIGTPESFSLDVHNTSTTPAFNLTLTDRLPNGATGGMCDVAPSAFTARVFQADGVTPVSAPLVPGTDFAVSFSGDPACTFTFAILTAAGTVGPDQRLIVGYQTQLDAGTQNGVLLTNVAGATEWFSAESGAAERRSYTRTLTDGTPAVIDHEDAHTVGVGLPAYLFEKTVANVTSGANPTATAAPGDVLRYTLRLSNTSDVPLADLAFVDDLGSLNPGPAFVPGSLSLVSVPPGADASGTNPNGGTNGTGLVDVRNLSLPGAGELLIVFDVTLASSLADGTVVTNQTQLLSGGTLFTVSDDPNQNGPADPFVAGDEDPTRVQIVVPPANALAKANTQATATIGVPFSYQVTVPETPFAFPLYDVRITDDLAASAADLRFVSVAKVSGSGPWTPVNTGTDTQLVIEDPNLGIDIPAGEQVVVEITVVLEDTPTNVAGLAFTNTADYTWNWTDEDDTSQRPGAPGTSPPMTIVEPVLTLEKSGPAQMTVGTPATFTLDVHDASTTPAWNLTITDRLPNLATGGTCDVAPSAFTAQLFQADGVTPVSAPLVQGTDFAVSWSGDPACSFTLTILSAAGTIGPDQRLIVSYQTQLDADTQDGVALTNVAGATEWFGAESTATDRRTYTRALTDGTVGVLDHEDAHTVTVAVPGYLFEKTVANVTTGADPATTATPGDRLRYRIRIENLGDVPLANLTLFDELDRLNAPAAFAPGTLALISVPAGADASNTNPTGGAQGTGVVDVRNLTVPGPGSVVVEFEITLAAVIANGTLVTNQSQLLIGGAPFALSDDPNVNGPADPLVAGDEDPTRILIESAPDFRVEKTSTDLTGDPNILLAGETLRYTITVKNVGTADATDAVLRDALPANTSYVAGSTTLNGTPVPDGPGGSSPLEAGIQLSAPENPTPGFLRADASSTTSNVATVVFDVVIDAGVANGTVISNQGFVSAPDGGVTDQPSDDPATPVPDDPTRDVVGNAPDLFAAKRAALLVDAGSPGVVDPGDVLRYTITVTNDGAVPATNVVLSDAVPANTTYVADTTTLNGLPVGQPDGGVFPLAAGLPISSADLTPPLPGPGAGTLNPGQSAVVEFDLQVNAGVPGGTLIVNQATVQSAELPDLPSDGDGNPATGPEPTVVLVGDGQQLVITKQVAVVGGGPALPGAQVEYLVSVLNIAAVPAFQVVITDDLGAAFGQLSYVAGSATMNGSAAGVNVAGSLITADYSGTYGPLAPGSSIVLRFRATIAAGLPAGTTITNTGTVTWNDPTQTASASVSFDVGGVPGIGALNGTAWHDADFDRAVGGSERPLVGWIVELLQGGASVRSVLTDSSGAYRIDGVTPNDAGGAPYELRFRAPDAGPSSASLGHGHSVFTNGPQRIGDIVVTSGGNLQNLNLPIDPNGAVYDAIARTPIAGATLALLGAGGSPLPASCFDDPVQQGQITRSDGYYKFDLNFADAACPSGASYLIGVTAPASAYVAGISAIIPPVDPATPLPVPSCPGTASDAVPTTGQHCEAQPSELAPPASVPPRSAGTTWYVHLLFDASQAPGSSQIFNNHIPLDPVLDDALGITKKTPLMNVSRGQLVPYEIVVTNVFGSDLSEVGIVDRYPGGFKYVEGSARIDGVPFEPTVNGRELTWSGLGVGVSGRRTLQLLLAVGGGVTEGEYVNRAFAINALTGAPISGEAHATVRVLPDFTFDCTDVFGKVFNDADRNGVQGPEELGLAGVRLVTARGLVVTTDPHGRFHITCALTPNEDRGSNFVLKLDDRTLPSGYRLSTRQTLVQRATRGKALRFNFAASIHRVVGLDVADAVFEPGSTEMREHWRPRLARLLEELGKEPAVLRLSYAADVEDPDLVERRLATLKRQILDAWQAPYPLTIEPEVFWHRGAPPEETPVRESDRR